MSLHKNEILAYLKELEVDDLVRNIQIMGNTVMIDMKSHSPAMHEKKRLELGMKNAFADKFGDAVELKLNLIVETPEAPAIKGKRIDGIKLINAATTSTGTEKIGLSKKKTRYRQSDFPPFIYWNY